MELYVLWLVVFLALSFDFINGFHDTANAIATSVSTRALKPRTAILLASVMNFVGALSFTGVAKMIGGGVADPAKLEHGVYIVIATLIAAIAWNLITWWFGIPSSSSHALIGSLAGAVIGAAGFGGINASGFIDIIKALILSPLIAFAAGFIIMWLLKRIFANSSPHSVNKGFRFCQIITASFQAFSHGTNDAQKAMGIITFALVAAGIQDTLDVPLWVKISAATAMALGTSVGGWKIIKTMGTKIFKIEPINGFAADITSASVILSATVLHFPVSTTHVITSAILGVGSAKRFSSVKWGVAGRIVMAWFITIPITMVFAALVFGLIEALFL
ncbi:putative low-affinity inorganic phosphate transporter [Paenibacillus cisolokensis]|jgi:Phosphate/sulphate permeases|uniref:Low-affinity inorganic phosphate transporter n=1 Tax=Paenibacillus cisolokensis TaxID=1658519 RepID=A0ABQ4NE27_9BACL|nr:inorganic phosphate transporter [Paenibacillus cisolokensis]GIQ66457.1 putative low-affinity inorganic phosphate transporter [Paenibacillus cisolokensis]